VYICYETWSSENVRHFYNVALLVLQYCIPFAVLLFTYISIGIVVWGKRTPGEAENTRDVRMAKSKRKVTLFNIICCSFNTVLSSIICLFIDDKNDGNCGHSVYSVLATLQYPLSKYTLLILVIKYCVTYFCQLNLNKKTRSPKL